MRILVWPADAGAGGHYRLQWPAEALIAQGADILVDRVGPVVMWDREWHTEDPPLDAVVLGVEKPDCDIVVLQRPGRAHWTHVIRFLQAHGIKVVVDVDDDLTAIPRENLAHAAYSPAGSPFHSSDWVMRACELADLVTVSTPALAKLYGRHGRVRVMPNLVPAAYLSIEAERDPVAPMVGWSGSVETHPHDLEVTGGGIHRALMSVPGSRFGVIGTGVGVSARLGCRVDRVTGWVPFAEYPHAVAGLDVGIVPLAPSRFNASKSCLKGMEYAALGVAPVMSPTPDNLRLNLLGVGEIAANPQQWKKKVTRLLASADRRAELAGMSREIMSSLTYERRADLWLDAWSSVADREMAVAS